MLWKFPLFLLQDALPAEGVCVPSHITFITLLDSTALFALSILCSPLSLPMQVRWKSWLEFSKWLLCDFGKITSCL